MPGYRRAQDISIELLSKKPVESPVEERGREYKHSIVTSTDEDLGAILSHIEGSSLTVDYYAQLKGRDEEPKEYDINQLQANQQYHLIQNLEMKLQSQDQDTEDETNRAMMSGTATIYAGVIPNVGDVILTDIGAGQVGRATIKNVTKKQYFRRAVYEVDFELIEFMDTKSKVEHLNTYVVKTSVFSKEMLTYGMSPVILEQDFADSMTATDLEMELIDDYLKEFFSNEMQTFVVPGYMYATYDPYIVEVFRQIVNLDEHPMMQRLKTLNVNEIKEAYSFSIWPVLLNPEVHKVKNIWRKAGPVSYERFHVNPKISSFRYSGFKQCISPVEDLQNIDYYHGWAQQPKIGTYLTTMQVTSIMLDEFGAAIGEQLAKDLAGQNKVCCHHLVYYHEANPKAIGPDSARYLDLVHTWVRATGHWSACSICGGCDECCNCNDEPDQSVHSAEPFYYVLPPTFWDDNIIDDPFSNMVRRYINGDQIPLRAIITYAQQRDQLTPRRRFYEMMVLLIILRSSIRGI